MINVTETQDETAAGFVIDGARYDIPSLYSFDMDENKIMFDLSGKPTEEWLLMLEAGKADSTTDERVMEIDRELKNPGLLRAMVHVAYRRAHPDMEFGDVDVVIGRQNHVANWAALFLASPKVEDEVSDPPVAGVTGRDDVSSPSVTPASSTSEDSSRTHGNDSKSGSDQPGVTHEPIGTGGSDTSSPVSRARMSVR